MCNSIRQDFVETLPHIGQHRAESFGDAVLRDVASPAEATGDNVMFLVFLKVGVSTRTASGAFSTSAITATGWLKSVGRITRVFPARMSTSSATLVLASEYLLSTTRQSAAVRARALDVDSLSCNVGGLSSADIVTCGLSRTCAGNSELWYSCFLHHMSDTYEGHGYC